MLLFGKSAVFGCDLISVQAKQWLDEKSDKDTSISAIKQAYNECGICSYDSDPLCIRPAMY